MKLWAVHMRLGIFIFWKNPLEASSGGCAINKQEYALARMGHREGDPHLV